MNKVWSYIISRSLNNAELSDLTAAGNAFVSDWTAHENKLSASFEILKQRIILVKVNENINSASGCSIDKLTRFVKQAESRFGIELLNRFLVAYKSEDNIDVIHASKIKDLLSENKIDENTLVYNTAISSEDELENWEQPLKTTWLNKYLIKA